MYICKHFTHVEIIVIVIISPCWVAVPPGRGCSAPGVRPLRSLGRGRFAPFGRGRFAPFRRGRFAPFGRGCFAPFRRGRFAPQARSLRSLLLLHFLRSRPILLRVRASAYRPEFPENCFRGLVEKGRLGVVLAGTQSFVRVGCRPDLTKEDPL